MAFIDLYNVAYSQTVNLTGRDEITENISLTASPKNRTNAGGRYLFANIGPGMYRVKSNKQEVVA